MLVALAQVLTGPDPDANLRLVREAIAGAAGTGAELVVFPEASMRAFGAGPLDEVAEEVDGPWASAVRDAAREHGVVVAAGMFRPADSGRVHNTLLVTGPDVHRGYDKIHLFDAFDFAESDTVAPGQELALVEVGGVTVGLTVCYDIRFGEQFRALAQAGAEVIVCAASWGEGENKLEQWRLLAGARALDSTCFVVACDQADPRSEGVEPTSAAPTGIGHSLVAGPLGDIRNEAGDGVTTLVVDLPMDDVAQARKVLPVLSGGRVTEPRWSDPGRR